MIKFREILPHRSISIVLLGVVALQVGIVIFHGEVTIKDIHLILIFLGLLLLFVVIKFITVSVKVWKGGRSTKGNTE